jgi:hypothetical protein
MCMPGTRVSLLQDILAWAGDSDSPRVLWLNGLSGTGKSTIARTFCQRLHEQGLLGASFFIARDHGDSRNVCNIVHSIAYQLAVRWPAFSDVLCAQLRDTPASATRSLQQQITDFIITPARAVLGDKTLIIVIDALDQCISASCGRPGGYFLLYLIRGLQQLDGCVKLFFASRDEMPIMSMIRDVTTSTPPTVIRLHDLDLATVRNDIKTYLNQWFARMRAERRDLSLDDWPSNDDVDMLAAHSGLLFIHTAITVRLVNDPKHSPRRRLAHLLRQGKSCTSASPYGQLDMLYRQVLKEIIRESGGDEQLSYQRLRAVMAVIVLQQGRMPLDIKALAMLSGVAQDVAAVVVTSLSTLLADNANGIRVFHDSVSQFVRDSSRCNEPRLLFDHGLVALQCLTLMNKHLHYDIRNIQDPLVANKDVRDLGAVLHDTVPDALRYAACFWCIHLTNCIYPDGPLLDALDKFCRKHTLHWVELLSLLEYVSQAEMSLLEVTEWCEVCQGHHKNE